MQDFRKPWWGVAYVPCMTNLRALNAWVIRWHVTCMLSLAGDWQGRRALSNHVCAHSVISMWHVVCLQHLARASSEQSRSTTVLPINHVIQMPQCLSGFVNHDYWIGMRCMHLQNQNSKIKRSHVIIHMTTISLCLVTGQQFFIFSIVSSITAKSQEHDGISNHWLLEHLIKQTPCVLFLILYHYNSYHIPNVMYSNSTQSYKDKCNQTLQKVMDGHTYKQYDRQMN